jgi:hypothetical protein
VGHVDCETFLELKVESGAWTEYSNLFRKCLNSHANNRPFTPKTCQAEFKPMMIINNLKLEVDCSHFNCQGQGCIKGGLAGYSSSTTLSTQSKEKRTTSSAFHNLETPLFWQIKCTVGL